MFPLLLFDQIETKIFFRDFHGDKKAVILWRTKKIKMFHDDDEL